MKLKANKRRNVLLKILSVLGPGVVTAALVFGPSKMTITSKMGADFSFDLLWVVVVAIFFMLIFTNMSARIGASNRETLLTLIRRRMGKWSSLFIGIGIFLVATSFQAGNSTGVGIALGEATGTGAGLWVILFNLMGIGLLFFRSFYRVLEKVMLVLVILMLACFLTTLLLIDIPMDAVLGGLRPTLPTGSIGLVVAFIASCFSLVGAFYQSYLVQEKRKTLGTDERELDRPFLSSTVGILILGLMSAVVLICAGAVLHPAGIQVNSASEMGLALAPLFGDMASHLFLVGLFAASFSSLVGNAVLGGSLLGDALGLKSGLRNNKVKVLIALVMLFGAIISVVFNHLPLELIVLAQSVTIFLVPFIGFSIWWMAGKSDIMGEQVNTPFQRVAGAAGLLLIVLLAVVNFDVLFLTS